MKHFILSVIVMMACGQLRAQQPATQITTDNSWFKAGINAGVPIGNLSDVSNFTLGIDLKGQLMSTKHLGIGLGTGYNHFFPKNGLPASGTIPAGAFIRYYPRTSGFFIGTDLGYSFFTGSLNSTTGGPYIRPQAGYHNRYWNFFGFYNGIYRNKDNGGNVQFAGVGVAYNIMFK